RRRSRVGDSDRRRGIRTRVQLGYAGANYWNRRPRCAGRRCCRPPDRGAQTASRGFTMIALSGGVSYIDLEFSGISRIIATVVLQGAGGVALIDPGPSSTLHTLRSGLERAGIKLADVNAIVLSHIHLDHAGASGTLVHENPAMRVYVHERGAAHLADPTKL